MKNFYHAFFFFILTTALTACGFHLQGKKNLALPLHRIYLNTSDPYGSLARNLQDYLKMSKAQVVDSPEQADTILAILQDTTTQELLAPSGTLQTRQYKLRVTVVFEINDNQGRLILAPQTLTEERPITIQSNQILGSSNDVALYYQQMRRALAYAVMNRIASTEVSAIITHAFQSPVRLIKQ